jgi:hypothetical protein
MKKIETIWQYLLFQAIEQCEFRHTQAGLAQLFHYSTSTINLALVKPTAIGAVRKSGKFFIVADVIKLLYLASTIRSLTKDIMYHTYSDLPIHELEGLAPADTIFAGYTAASQILSEPPADYTSLYLYLDPSHLDLAKSRYPSLKSGPTQVYILRSPTYLPLKPRTTLPHTFVDIWNMRDWYARDFTQALEAKINGLLS